MMRFTICCCLAALSLHATAQKSGEVILMDFVKITEGRKAEAMFFYENNWKVYREAALKQKIIKAYELLETRPDTLNNFDLVLITIYEDTAQYAKSEANFAPILKQLRPQGPVLLNDFKPNDFRKNIFFKIAGAAFSSAGRREN